MSNSEAFTFVERESSGPSRMFDDYKDLTSAKVQALDVQMVARLRSRHPEMIVTSVPGSNVNLLQFAAAGFATADLDTKTDDVVRWRGFIPPPPRGGKGYLADAMLFGKYHYKWNEEDFILYNVLIGFGFVQYIIKEPREGESTESHSAVTDSLLSAIGAWLTREIPAIWVYDGYWTRSTKMYDEIQKAKWDDVILDKKMKSALTSVTEKFFDSRDVYEKYGVPWKRGIMFHGPPGNGKTISIKALMHTLNDRKIPCLYVKSASYTYQISRVFLMARAMSPCMLILEDIDTIVTPMTRSYFFNEVDGLENNDGIFMVASTNHLDELDPGLSKRPSRFDRKYLFPLPDKDERVLYCQYWRNKLKDKEEIDFPMKLCGPMATITDKFSFAYLKEAFVSTLLELARNHTNELGFEADTVYGEDSFHEFEDLDKYELWRYFKEQVKVLRDEADDGSPELGTMPRIRPFLRKDISRETDEPDYPFADTCLIRGRETVPGSAIGALPHRHNVHSKAADMSVESVDRLFFKPLASLENRAEEGHELGLNPMSWF